MYARKIKLMTGKKKGKSPAPPGSVWGPRIALAEKEKALSASLPLEPVGKDGSYKKIDGIITQTNTRKQNSYINNPPSSRPQLLPRNHNHHNDQNNPLPLPPTPRGQQNYKKISVSSASSNHTGSYSGNHNNSNYIYNYARKSSNSGSGGGGKSFFLAHPPPPPSSCSRSSQRSSSNKTTSYGGGSTYILGSNSGSHVTLSTVGETMSQPLTLIIPPVSSSSLERFIEVGESDYEDGNAGGGGLYNMEQDQHSFPSTKTYCSSQDEGDEEEREPECNQSRRECDVPQDLTVSGQEKAYRNNNNSRHPYYSENNSRNPLPSKCEQIFANPAINLGILKVSTTQPIIHHYDDGGGGESNNRNHKNTTHHQQQKLMKDDTITLSDNNKRDKRMLNKRMQIMQDHISKGRNNEEDIGEYVGGNIVSRDERRKHKLGEKHCRPCHKNQIQSLELLDSNNSCNSKNNKNNSVGSTISSLAQGMMMYVPMESLPRSKSAAVLNASLEFDPDLTKLVKECQEQNTGAKIVNTIVDVDDKNREQQEEGNDPDNDSLLESFDSVMFQPRDDDETGITANSNNNVVNHRHREISSSSSSLSSGISTPTQPQSPNVTITKINNNYYEQSPNSNNYNETGQISKTERMISMIKESVSKIPPPLPPKNPSMLKLKPKLKFNDNMFANIAKRNNGKFINPFCKVDFLSTTNTQPPSGSQREENIRNAVENLENIIRPQSTSTTRTPSPNLNLNNATQSSSSSSPPKLLSDQKKENERKKELPPTPKNKPFNKRVTFPLPNKDLLTTREQEEEQQLQLLLNNSQNDTDTEIDAYSSSFLTCSHHILKEDNYSTLSSTHSPHITKEDDEAGETSIAINDGNNHCQLNHHNQSSSFCTSTPEVSPSHPSCSSSSSNNESGNSPLGGKEKNRSVLQQLRELSILIGGNGTGSGPYAENDKLFQNKKETKKVPAPQSFRLHNEEDPTRKISDATDNSADSGKGSGTGSSTTAASISAGSSPQSFQSSPTDSLQQQEGIGIVATNTTKQHLLQKNAKTCPGDGVSSSPCVFRSDCNECLMFNKPVNGFQKPDNSSEICGKSETLLKAAKKMKQQLTSSNKKSTPSKLILRRKSSKSSKGSSKPSRKKPASKHLVLEYCDCSSCCCDFEQRGNDIGQRRPHPPLPPIPTSSRKSSTTTSTSEGFSSNNGNARKISTTSSYSSSSSSVKLSRSVAFRSSSRANLSRLSGNKSSPLSNSELNSNINGLFTIEEEENYSVDSKLRNNKIYNSSNGSRSAMHKANNTMNSTEAAVFSGGGGSCEEEGFDVTKKSSPHWHPECWLAADPLLSGWSDLESLYSLNVKNNDGPLSINGECWKCWDQITEIKRNSENPNGTVDRTKRMFIWLNQRHKEFSAPWWEAKKQASIRWVMTKALIHVPKEYLMDPFKESKKSKPIKYRLRDEVIKGLVNGKLYSLALDNLYRDALGVGEGERGHPGAGKCLNLWDIIKILSRRGVYTSLPSDMKLTEGTLRHKPIRIAAHIALIEALMCLYSKEILAKERIMATLYTFGCTVKSDTISPERLVIAWINASVMTLKSYIVSTRNHQLSPEKQSRWLKLPKIGEIRDLCDGIGICSLFAIYCSNDLKPMDISVPEPDETLTIYDSISNHTLVQKLCEQLFPETIYHLCVTDFLYIHGYMKQNILCFLVDLFIHLEINPIVRVNRLTHVPVRVDLA